MFATYVRHVCAKMNVAEQTSILQAFRPIIREKHRESPTTNQDIAYVIFVICSKLYYRQHLREMRRSQVWTSTTKLRYTGMKELVSSSCPSNYTTLSSPTVSRCIDLLRGVLSESFFSTIFSSTDLGMWAAPARSSKIEGRRCQ